MDTSTRSLRAQDPARRERTLTRRELRATSATARERVRARARAIAAKSITLAAMAFVALLTVGVSIPASAFAGYADQASFSRDAPGKSQVYTVAADAIDVSGERDGYQATSREQFQAAAAAAAAKAAARQAAAVRSNVAGFNPSGTGAVRWPYPYSVRLGPGFGAPATCSTCMSVHQGQDFLGPNGAPIYSIAAGVVVTHSATGSFGNHVIIQHQIDGQTVTSLYAHMQPGSVSLNAGDTVQVGQLVGLTGSTGSVTAPHLHLEITVNGAKVDPYAYLQAHAG